MMRWPAKPGLRFGLSSNIISGSPLKMGLDWNAKVEKASIAHHSLVIVPNVHLGYKGKS